MNRPIIKFVFYFFLLSGIGLVGLWIAHSKHGGSGQVGSGPVQPGSSSSEPKALYWYDPMFPNQHFDHPGKSPFMDMQLVARTAGEETTGTASAAGTVCAQAARPSPRQTARSTAAIRAPRNGRIANLTPHV